MRNSWLRNFTTLGFFQQTNFSSVVKFSNLIMLEVENNIDIDALYAAVPRHLADSHLPERHSAHKGNPRT